MNFLVKLPYDNTHVDRQKSAFREAILILNMSTITACIFPILNFIRTLYWHYDSPAESVNTSFYEAFEVQYGKTFSEILKVFESVNHGVIP